MDKGDRIATRNQRVMRLWLLALLAALAAFIVYLPALDNGFLNWDDNRYISANPFMRPIDTGFVLWAFSTFRASNWHPLTWLSLGLDCSVWGFEPMGYHLTNVLLHSLNVLLVTLLAGGLFRVAMGVLDWRGLFASALVGVLFGVHPLHVESVAWVAERKDVLYAFFWLLGLHAYLGYSRSKNPGQRSLRYALCLFFFALSLMSKPMAVTLPVVLLLMDVYPLGRLASRGDMIRVGIVEKLPFFAMSIASASVTILAQQAAMVDIGVQSLAERLWVAVRALGFYLAKTVFPVNLSPFYPLPLHGTFVGPEHVAALIAVIAITLACVWSMKKSTFYPVLWVYFVVTLLPTLGIIQVGVQAAADRYMYLPVLAPLFLVGAGVARAWEGRYRKYLPVLALVVAVLLSTMTVRQIGVWKSTSTLWERVMGLYPQDSHPHAGRALGAMEEERYEDALSYIVKAIEMEQGYSASSPKLHWLYNIRADVQMALGRHREAAGDFSRAIELNPAVEAYYLGRAKALEGLGELVGAVSDYQKAVSLKPDYVEALNSLGVLYRKMGDYEKAVKSLNRAIARSPYEPGLYLNRGNAYAAWGRAEMALEDYRMAARMGYKPAQDYLRSIGSEW
jgi:Tfp pilus assembly protein PilF